MFDYKFFILLKLLNAVFSYMTTDDEAEQAEAKDQFYGTMAKAMDTIREGQEGIL